MSDEFLQVLKGNWNAVLDELERDNRIAWLAYFDARLVSFDGTTLILNFADAEKFSGAHDYSAVRKPAHRDALIKAIKRVTDLEVEVREY